MRKSEHVCKIGSASMAADNTHCNFLRSLVPIGASIIDGLKVIAAS